MKFVGLLTCGRLELPAVYKLIVVYFTWHINLLPKFMCFLLILSEFIASLIWENKMRAESHVTKLTAFVNNFKIFHYGFNYINYLCLYNPKIWWKWVREVDAMWFSLPNLTRHVHWHSVLNTQNNFQTGQVFLKIVMDLLRSGQDGIDLLPPASPLN